MARIVTVYSTERRATRLIDMSYIRWFRISEALARLGHRVDLATAESKWRLRKPVVRMGERVRRVPISRVRWEEYDVVKTLFHRGFRTLERYRGSEHPFIISKLGSVVGPEEVDGIYFYGRTRATMYAIQERIARAARFVTLLSEPARELWTRCFGSEQEILLVPGAADREIPPPGPDPYPARGRPRCVFAGNFYTLESGRSQPRAHQALVEKLNELGARLTAAGARLYVVGPGDPRLLDRSHVSYLGVVRYEESWDYLHHADVGVVVAPGPLMHNNESSKIYHYLRVGLPVASEAGFPNDDLVREAGCGFVVENGNLALLAERAVEAARTEWDREAAVRFILENHTWDRRAEVYDGLLAEYISS